ncbi:MULTISPECIES: RraA family protein [Paenibacillus]|uniref:RraA family protein n=1 Tax=Paenibacillus TaxID=44249 RepID=UPI00157721B8|nr:RraA family protein [Paenibacillus sp. JMULE4]NTZ19244.1 RraA family protein [Paenibacillus sp. JMULE4]
MPESQQYYDTLQEKLYSAVISDILDAHGYRNQTMHPDIRPLTPDMVVVGRAKTVQVADVHRIPEKPYEKQIQVLDAIQPGEIFVGAVNGSKRSAFFGELMSTATQVAGGRGAIIDGMVRDAKKILELGFPVFSIGFRPTDSLGRNEVIEYDVTIECGGVTVQPGDLIFGDMDGVVVIPKAIEKLVIEQALDKVSGENLVRDKIREGMKVSEVFQTYGIL